MKEIKFRAWDEKNKRISRGNLAITGDGVKWWLFAGSSGIIDARDFTIEQYTGLKDKNGKEIYEGDIVRLPIGVEVPIVFKNGSFCVYGYHWENELCEVVGNIHENPELLK